MAAVLVEGGKALKLGGKGRVNEVIDAVRDLAIPKGELLVVGGAALQVFGIKRTEDIDLVVQPERMTLLVQEATNEENHWLKYHKKLGNLGTNLTVIEPNAGIVIETGDEYSLARKGNISFMLPPNDHLYAETFENLLENSTSVQGVNVLLPEAVLTWKRAVARPKDARDVAAIERYLDAAPTSADYLSNMGVTFVTP